ncbi:MAG: tetratricopeptide repeat protein [Verrucomicrobia bacterium]|nr:tetratricopeptide repeat protein [Verrucomicrobiota bacterium]
MRKMTLHATAQLALLTATGAVGQAQDANLASALQTSYEAEAKGDYPAAIKPLEGVGAANKANYITQLRLGWLYYCSKDWSKSTTHYNTAIELAPFAIEPLLGLMLPQMAAGKNDDALRTAQLAVRLDPNNYTALSRTAWLAYLRQDYRAATSTYRKLVALYPTDTEMLLGLGFSLKLSGNAPEAMQYFRTVLLLSPNNPRAKQGLGEDAGGGVGGGGGDRPGPPRGERPPFRPRGKF